MYMGTYNRLRVHVSATPREVIRAASKKLAKAAMGRKQRAARHAFYRQVLKCHEHARNAYQTWRF